MLGHINAQASILMLQVFTATLDLLALILEHWIPRHKLHAGQTVEIILPEVMARIGDTVSDMSLNNI